MTETEKQVWALLDKARYATDDDERAKAAVGLVTKHTALVEQRDRLVEVLKEAMKIVSDRAAGGRMLTTADEASAVWNKYAKVIYNVEQAEHALATVEQDGGEL